MIVLFCSASSASTGHLGDRPHDGAEEGEVLPAVPGRAKAQTSGEETGDCLSHDLLDNIKHQVSDCPASRELGLMSSLPGNNLLLV